MGTAPTFTVLPSQLSGAIGDMQLLVPSLITIALVAVGAFIGIRLLKKFVH